MCLLTSYLLMVMSPDCFGLSKNRGKVALSASDISDQTSCTFASSNRKLVPKILKAFAMGCRPSSACQSTSRHPMLGHHGSRLSDIALAHRFSKERRPRCPATAWTNPEESCETCIRMRLTAMSTGISSTLLCRAGSWNREQKEMRKQGDATAAAKNVVAGAEPRIS